jgi:hypothetical protein
VLEDPELADDESLVLDMEELRALVEVDVESVELLP